MARQISDEKKSSAVAAINSVGLRTIDAMESVARARDVIEAAGGIEFALNEVARGKTVAELARFLNIAPLSLTHYINAKTDETLLSQVKESSYDAKFSALYEDASMIEMDHRRVKAQTDLLTMLASKETLKYKDTSKGADSGAAISIHVDWAGIQAGAAPRAIVLDGPTGEPI
jgi:hypothetical protein